MKNLIKVTLIYLIIMYSYGNAQCQINCKWFQVGKTPLKSGFYGFKINSPEYILPQGDIQKANERFLTALKDSTRNISVIGSTIPLKFNAENYWVKEKTNNGLIKKISLKVPNAKAISINFDRLILKNGSELILYNSDQDFLMGPITEKDLNSTNFLTDFIPGDMVNLEIFDPTGNDLNEISFGEIGFAFIGEMKNPFNNTPEVKIAACEINVSCPAGDPFLLERDAIGCINVNYNGFLYRYSGCLIGNTSNDFKAYILTAMHCIDIDGNNSISIAEKTALTNNLTCRFFYESASCGTNTSGSYVYYNTATFRAAYRYTDMALIQLNNNPQDCRLSYLGWNRTSAMPSTLTCLHHPENSVMKIAIAPAGSTANTVPRNPGTLYFPTGYCHVIHFGVGTIELGSSGAPFLNQNSQVVGQVGAGNVCDPYLENFGGRFYYSWDAGGAVDQRLKEWLDPTNTGATITTTIRNSNISGQNIVCSSGNYQYTLTAAPTGLNAVSITWTAPDFSPSSGTGSTANVYINAANSGNHIITFNVPHPAKGLLYVTKTVWVGIQTPSPINIIMDAPPNRFTAGIEATPFSTYNWYLNGVLNSNHTDVVIFQRLSPYCGGSYNVQVEAVNTCGISSKRSTTAIEPACGSGLLISPNPASENIEVTIDDSNLDSSLEPVNESYNVSITNLYGIPIYTSMQNKKKFIISVSNFQEGTYIISVKNGDKVFKEQLIIGH
jgi:hypothetical protein